MAGHVQAEDDTHPKAYRLVFYGDIRSRGDHWTQEQCGNVQAAFMAFLEEHGARYVEEPRVIWITPAGEPVAKTR